MQNLCLTLDGDTYAFNVVNDWGPSTHEIPNEDNDIGEDLMKKFNLTSSREGVSLELFDPRKKLHYLMTFWKDSKSSGNSAMDAIEVIKQ